LDLIIFLFFLSSADWCFQYFYSRFLNFDTRII